MDSKRKTEMILMGIAAFLSLTFLVILPIDVIRFFRDKETYISVYDLNVNKGNWEWQYLNRWIFLALLSIAGLTVMTLRVIREGNPVIQKINRVFLFFFFGSMIIGFYSWMKTGFDH